MCGKQKTETESYPAEARTESPESKGAPSVSISETDGRVTYDNLIETLLSDDNIETALKQVVANRGSPGVDMTEPVCTKVYSGNDKSVFRDFLESNGIISGLVLTDKGFSYENAKVFLDNPALHFLIP